MWLLGPGEETGVARAEGDETCQKGGPTYEQQCPVCPGEWATAMPVTGGIRGGACEAQQPQVTWYQGPLSGARAGVPSRPSLVRRCFLTPDVRFNHKLLSRDSSARDHAPLVPQLQLPSTSQAHPTDPLYARRMPIIQR